MICLPFWLYALTTINGFTEVSSHANEFEHVCHCADIIIQNDRVMFANYCGIHRATMTFREYKWAALYISTHANVSIHWICCKVREIYVCLTIFLHFAPCDILFCFWITSEPIVSLPNQLLYKTINTEMAKIYVHIHMYLYMHHENASLLSYRFLLSLCHISKLPRSIINSQSGPISCLISWASQA